MKRSEQIVELMDDVKKIISQMAVVDVREEKKKPVEVGKTIMTSREVADMFQEYHSVTYRRIAQLIVELEPMEQTEFKMAQFKARHQEYPMWELTEKACKLYLARMKRDRCYGKKKTGIEKMEKELRCRVSGQKLVEDAENGYKDVRELFNQFITGPKGENREIPELTGIRTSESGYGSTGSRRKGRYGNNICGV